MSYLRKRAHTDEAVQALNELEYKKREFPMLITESQVVKQMALDKIGETALPYVSIDVINAVVSDVRAKTNGTKTISRGYKQFEKLNGYILVPITDYLVDEFSRAKRQSPTATSYDIINALSPERVYQSLPHKGASAVGVIAFTQGSNCLLLDTWLIMQGKLSDGLKIAVIERTKKAAPEIADKLSDVARKNLLPHLAIYPVDDDDEAA